MLFKSVISNSPRAEGFNDLAYSHTFWSYKYNPVTAKLDLGFTGFSSIDKAFPYLSNVPDHLRNNQI